MSSRLRSRSGTSRRSARWSTISRLGCARPVSTKLRCLVEMSASQGQVELAEAAALAPFAQQIADRLDGCGHYHGPP